VQDTFKWRVCDSKLTYIFGMEWNLESDHFKECDCSVEVVNRSGREMFRGKE